MNVDFDIRSNLWLGEMIVVEMEHGLVIVIAFGGLKLCIDV